MALLASRQWPFTMWAGRNDQFRSHVLHGLVYAAALHDAASQGRYSKLKGEPKKFFFLEHFLIRSCLAVKICSEDRPVETSAIEIYDGI